MNPQEKQTAGEACHRRTVFCVHHSTLVLVLGKLVGKREQVPHSKRVQARALGSKQALVQVQVLGSRQVLVQEQVLGSKQVLVQVRVLGSKRVLGQAQVLGSKQVLVQVRALGSKPLLVLELGSTQAQVLGSIALPACSILA